MLDDYYIDVLLIFVIFLFYIVTRRSISCCYVLFFSCSFKLFSRHWEQKLKCLVRTAILGDGDGEVDLNAIKVLRKLCSPNAFPQACDKEKNGERNLQTSENDATVETPPVLSSVAYAQNADEDAIAGSDFSSSLLPELSSEQQLASMVNIYV